MPGFDYAKSEATADRLIERFGQDGSIRRTSNSGGDPWNPVRTPADHACKVAIVSYTNREVDGSLVLATDQKAIVAKGTLTIDPMPKDELIVGPDVFQIIRLAPLNPGGIVVMFEAQVRK